MKVIKIVLMAITIVLLLNVQKVHAEQTIDIYFFRGEGCPHCAKEEIALEELKQMYSNIVVHDYEVWKNKDNQKLMKEVIELMGVNASGVPFTVIGEKTYSGFDENGTKDAMANRIKYYTDGTLTYKNMVGGYLDGTIKIGDNNTPEEPTKEEVENTTVSVPFIGKVELKSLSLPIITVILGALDGFNPCAMWVLLFLISMLLGMKDRKKMWILGLTFLTTSAAIYMLFMVAWLKFTSVIGTVTWLRMLIALVAMTGGFINLKTYLKDRKNDGCDVVDDKKRSKLFESVKKIMHQKSFILALFGIVALAASVNIIELACSAGFPVVFTSILTVNDLPAYQYIGYIFLYILVFLLDDIIIFVIAMLTFEVTGISTKYGRMSHLIGGIVMLVIGLLMVFKPAWLMFNF